MIKKINLLESARREICERKLILGNCHLFTNLRRKNIPLKCNQCDHDFATNMTLMKRKKTEQGLYRINKKGICERKHILWNCHVRITSKVII